MSNIDSADMNHHRPEDGDQNGYGDDDDVFERDQSDQHEVASTIQVPCHDLIATGPDKLESDNEREEEKNHQMRGIIPFEKLAEADDDSVDIRDLQVA